MNAEKFKSFIREIIKEEIKVILPQLLAEAFSSAPKQNDSRSITEHTKQITSRPAEKVVQKTPPKKQIKQYVKDPVLNKILNETVPNLPKDYTSVPAPSFDKIGGKDDLNYSLKQLMNESTESPQALSVQDSPAPQSVLDLPSVIPDNLKGIFNRDYSQLIKVIDKKAKNK
jgi:hypothetical protein